MDQHEFTKSLRKNMTDAERLLWRHLRAKRLDGAKFRRQQPIGPYIVDFIHFESRLIVEIDGGQHNASIYDEVRDEWLTMQGFKIVRFWNHDVLGNIESVLQKIDAELKKMLCT
ncbi:MAG: endonuclease domain-containing protein [Gammaproteobacteria bacterium]|nr:endonuclease domain-containing protein [Gammaproteobacteria bacterium]